MLHKLSFALLFAVLMCQQVASAQNSPNGKCPQVKLLDKFDWPKFEGDWYEYARLPDSLEGAVGCVINSYRIIHNDTIGLVIWGVDKNNNKVDFDAICEIMTEAGLLLTFKDNGPKRIDRILGTDYSTWAVIFSCSETGFKHNEGAWILTRDRSPNAKTVDNAKKVLAQNNISPELLIETRQQNCHN